MYSDELTLERCWSVLHWASWCNMACDGKHCRKRRQIGSVCCVLLCCVVLAFKMLAFYYCYLAYLQRYYAWGAKCEQRSPWIFCSRSSAKERPRRYSATDCDEPQAVSLTHGRWPVADILGASCYSQGSARTTLSAVRIRITVRCTLKEVVVHQAELHCWRTALLTWLFY